MDTIIEYQNRVKADVKLCLEDMQCQPILFVGSGFSKRYFGAPNWQQLLELLSDQCPKIEKPFAYYKQSLTLNAKIATEFSDFYFDWAWEDRNNPLFPQELFVEQQNPKSIFIKNYIKNYLESITPSEIEKSNPYNKELDLFKKINPHCIITTNYDCFLERLCSDYTPVIGHSILKSQQHLIGEIFKIHGCISQPNTLVLTEEDYQNYNQKQKYLSAKLLTYFMEHPIIFLGYSLQDENIKALLSDIDEILGEKGETIKNIYFVQWSEKITSEDLKMEEIIPTEGNKHVRVKTIITEKFDWLYETLASYDNPTRVPLKTLRALMAKSYKLFRCDLAKNILNVNVQHFNNLATEEAEFTKVFGIADTSSSRSSEVKFPYTLTDIATKLQVGNTWHKAKKLLDTIKTNKNVDLQGSDNQYHTRISTGKGHCRKYSEECLFLLKKVMNNEDYTIDI